ncbi:MAG: flagellar L-ring protein precursor FlgH [Gammaproteobacteria bacterium]|jgi:flagellar L-ring protein precursor FlgH
MIIFIHVVFAAATRAVPSAAIVLCTLVLSGCMTQQPLRRPDYRPIVPTRTPMAAPMSGGLYQASTSSNLFSDVKAQRIGDVITVILREKTQANKSAKTNTAKDSSLELPNPTILGRQPLIGRLPLFNTSVDSSNSFDGTGDSSQSNSLSGDIAVTVMAAYPNGTLAVRGEKVLTLNQGSEFIRISGLVRAVDVTPQNTILSTQIADAQITYSGTGAVAESNQQGWLGRFFNSMFWPF